MWVNRYLWVGHMIDQLKLSQLPETVKKVTGKHQASIKHTSSKHQVSIKKATSKHQECFNRETFHSRETTFIQSWRLGCSWQAGGGGNNLLFPLLFSIVEQDSKAGGVCLTARMRLGAGQVDGQHEQISQADAEKGDWHLSPDCGVHQFLHGHPDRGDHPDFSDQ